MTIRRVAPTDAGTYTCRSANVIGHDEQSTVVTVQCTPSTLLSSSSSSTLLRIWINLYALRKRCNCVVRAPVASWLFTYLFVIHQFMFLNRSNNFKKKLNYNNLTNITRLYKIASSFAASAANVWHSMLLKLLTLFTSLVLRIATVCSADTQLNVSRQMSETSFDLVSKTFLKVLFITKFILLNCDLRKGQASKP